MACTRGSRGYDLGRSQAAHGVAIAMKGAYLWVPSPVWSTPGDRPAVASGSSWWTTRRSGTEMSSERWWKQYYPTPSATCWQASGHRAGQPRHRRGSCSRGLGRLASACRDGRGCLANRRPGRDAGRRWNQRHQRHRHPFTRAERGQSADAGLGGQRPGSQAQDHRRRISRGLQARGGQADG